MDFVDIKIEFNKRLRALALELPAVVYDDFSKYYNLYIAELVKRELKLVEAVSYYSKGASYVTKDGGSFNDSQYAKDVLSDLGLEAPTQIKD